MLSNLMVFLIAFCGCVKLSTEEQPLSGSLPPPFDTSKSFKRRPGVYIEKWEGIDSFKVSRLLEDSRFPYMPTYRTYGSMFTQPHNWGENYGTRIRAYFVPKVTGPHTFYISSDNEGQLWLSRDIWPEHKSKIAWIGEENFAKPYQYNKYATQKSWPVFLEKGQYYYMESLMKEYYDDDTFSVAVQLPGEKILPKGPIREEYLWTDIPRPYPNGNSVPDNDTIYRVAALAGARAGSRFGLAAATQAAAEAGAKAGRIAGLRAGAIAAKMAAVAAARVVFAKTFNATFAAYGKHPHGLKVRLINNNGNTISRQLEPASITNTAHIYNVHLKHHPNGQISFTETGYLPSYLPSINQGYPEENSAPNIGSTEEPSASSYTHSARPSSAPTDTAGMTSPIPSIQPSSIVPTSSSNEPQPIIEMTSMGPPEESSPSNIKQTPQPAPSTGYLPNIPDSNANIGSPLNHIKPPGFVNERNIAQVQGSSGQVMKKIQYVKKPRYYKYFGPAKGLKQQKPIKKSVQMSDRLQAFDGQDRQSVLRSDNNINPSWPLPISDPLQSLDVESQAKNQIKNDVGNTGVLYPSQNKEEGHATKKDGENTWPVPVFTSLDSPHTDQTTLSHPSETGQETLLGPPKNDQGIMSYLHDQQTQLDSPKNDQPKTAGSPNIMQTEDRKSIPKSIPWGKRNFEATLDPLTQFFKSNYNQDLNQSPVYDNTRQYPTTQDNKEALMAPDARLKNEQEEKKSISDANDLMSKDNETSPYPTPKFESLQGNISEQTTAYNQTQSTREGETFVYYPGPGEDPDDMARNLVYEDGCASKIVFNARYSIHSLDIPALQLNITQNNCINSFNGEISLRPFCQYFIIREGLLPHTDSDDISLESSCIPDHFLAQRNYRFYLLKRDGSLRFAREATFAFYKTISFPSSLQIMSFGHYMWFVCESKHFDKRNTKLILEYIRSKKDEFERCSFSFVPMPLGTEPHINCKAVLDHSKPEIKGNRWLEDTHKEPGIPHGATCLAINFINRAGRAFQVYSNIKNNKYLVTNNNLKVKTVIKRPDLHNHVTYRAETVEGDGEILLNGLQSFTVLPQRTCDEFVPVVVTSKPVQPVVIQHNHHHYHNAPQEAQPTKVTEKCPSLCSSPPPCPTTCPVSCCKRDKDST